MEQPGEIVENVGMVNGRFGSVAAPQDNISPTAAFGSIADARLQLFASQFSNVRFHQKQSFRSAIVQENDGQLAAKRGRLPVDDSAICHAFFRCCSVTSAKGYC
jgi:hypothetical protein